jgi:cytochrome c oxidase subunit IV
MNTAVRNTVLLWLLLIALAATAFGCSFLQIARSWRVVLLLPSIAMAAVIAIGFMEVRKGGALSLAFAVAALFWLCVLLGLGSMDPLTRVVYPAGLTIPG